MQTIWKDIGFLTILALTFSLSLLSAPQRTTYSPRELLNVLPSALDVHAVAIGNRIRVPGKERTLFTGVLLTERGEGTPLRIAVQLPNLVGLEGLRPNAPVVFDGTNPVLANSRIEEQLLEIFSSDTAEAMLVSIKNGAAATLVGRRVLEAVNSAPPQEAAHRYDIFEVVSPVWSNATNPDRLKRYFFDSETGLLARTEYIDETFSPPVNIEISFSDWRREAGSAYTGRIECKENGYPAFSITISSIVPLPRVDPTSLLHAGLQEE
jgi:hypothetical protein